MKRTKRTTFFPVQGLRHCDDEEFAPACVVAQCTTESTHMILSDYSTCDLMCLAANLNAALNNVVERIQKRTGQSRTETLNVIATIRANRIRIESVRKIKYVKSGVHYGR